MRIATGPDQPLKNVYLALTDDEASELRDALEELLAARPEDQFHGHVSDFKSGVEVTVYRADDATAAF